MTDWFIHTCARERQQHNRYLVKLIEMHTIKLNINNLIKRLKKVSKLSGVIDFICGVGWKGVGLELTNYLLTNK